MFWVKYWIQKRTPRIIFVQKMHLWQKLTKSVSFVS